MRQLRIFKAKEHYDRLPYSAKTMEITLPYSSESLEQTNNQYPPSPSI